MAVMCFSVDPGPLPFRTVRDMEKWLPRLANGQIEIRGENGVQLEQRMVRVCGMAFPLTVEEARGQGLFVPDAYVGRRLMVVHLEALDG